MIVIISITTEYFNIYPSVSSMIFSVLLWLVYLEIMQGGSPKQNRVFWEMIHMVLYLSKPINIRILLLARVAFDLQRRTFWQSSTHLPALFSLIEFWIWN